MKELSDIFQETLSLDTNPKGAESIRVLRSGSSHHRLEIKQESINPPPPHPPPTSTNPATATLTTTAVTTTQMTQPSPSISTMATPIKILPTTASVRPYSGAESDYSAREFIGQCEAVMRNASVTEPGDKIAFVKCNLQPGSMACKLMQSSMFWVPMENNDYKTPVARFYATFDGMGETNIVRGVTHLVDSIHKNSNSRNIFAAQIDARRFATDVTRYIKDAGWSTSDSLTFKEFEKFTEFFAPSHLPSLGFVPKV